MLSTKIPFYYVLFIVFGTALLTYSLVEWKEKAAATNEVYAEPGVANSCNYNLVRLNGYKFIHPLVYAEPTCESPAMSDIKAGIDELINSYKAQGLINTASVYVREFRSGSWVSAGEDRKFSPGSLLKVPELITLFKMNEKEPGFINKRILYDKLRPSNKNTTYVSKSIELGKSYTVRELMQYMIEYSDNAATNLLNELIDVPTFQKVFTDLGLPSPDWNAREFLITAKEYSQFMKVLYNGSYLNIDDSEYCTELLTKTDFREGFVSGLPSGCQLAHKFGEGGTDNSPQLSESGIIYNTGAAFILTVMTNGRDMKKLPQAISGITRLVYEKMNNHSVAGL